MTSDPKIVVSVEDYAGTEVVLHETTVAHIRFGHPDFSVNDIQDCLEDPAFVHTNPEDHPHPDRHNYYREASRGPRYNRVVVDHSTSPSRVMTAYRTQDIGNFGSMVYVRPSGGKR